MVTRILTGEPPRLKAPAGTTDTHIHFYDSGYSTLPGVVSGRAPGGPQLDVDAGDRAAQRLWRR